MNERGRGIIVLLEAERELGKDAQVLEILVEYLEVLSARVLDA